MVINKNNYMRVGHLEYQPIDSERSIVYPMRFFISVLSKILDWNEVENIINKYELHLHVPYGLKELQFVYNMVKKGLFTRTSSTGRFLDGVSAFLKISVHRSYDGEPAISLESYAFKGSYLGEEHFYPRIKVENGVLVIDTTSVYLELIEKLDNFSPKDIAYTIQYNLGRSLGEAVINVLKGKRRLSRKIVLGGGATVNTLIVKGLKDFLENEDIEVLLPRRIPCNDGGIALGQVASLIYSNVYSIDAKR